ncbi:DUF2325 domain-containing protein (plasmid) [Ureibacillus chungkukjangi]|uniref:DUF2325 domain-containing protein n=1 Tax=Ureibacillus chungkukjangi TaxID=1202712 RepID=UPI000D3928D3|nr:DUF2325 domain-containing protein [Ureibacillus chungkukjangi]MCM3389978.1 DUF2325 domain-containing protein [Ureibacillus chungkukjangi]
MKTKIAIIGGSQKQTFEKIGKKNNCEILFHGGKVRNGATRKEFLPIVKKADCVVVLLGAISHITMNTVKELCKEEGVKVIFQNGFGASLAIQSGLEAIAQSEVMVAA